MPRRPRSRIDRTPIALQALGVPIITTMMASLTPLIPAIASAPVMPPLGLMLLISWRLLHRNIWPAWMALPLGLWDDMFSGQPVGSAMLLWTLAMLGLDVLDRRMIWRDFWQDWGLAAAIISATLMLGLVIANATGGNAPLWLIMPQLVIAICLFPIVARICSVIDSWRLA